LTDALIELTTLAIGAADQSGGCPDTNFAPTGPRAMAAMVSPTVTRVTAMMLIRSR
jgi:hypothetical protein